VPPTFAPPRTRYAMRRATCVDCGDTFPQRRAALGYTTCLSCGDAKAVAARATWAVVPLPKQGYTRITRKEELHHLNQKPR
jgi:ribosomal protein L37AE/L43A